MPDLPAPASPASGQPASARQARSYQAAAAILAERDPVLRRLVAEAGPARVRPPGRAGGHDVGVGLDPRPGRGDALEQLDDQDRVHRALDRDAAGLALALAGVAVAERQQRALDVDAEV